MIGIEQASKALGLSERQLYRRITAARQVIEKHTGRGANNSLLLDGSAMKILQILEDYRRDGATMSQAVERIQDSIEGKSVVKREDPAANEETMPEAWRLLIAAKDELIEAQREEIAHLRHEVERLMPLALPSPRRGLLGLFRRRKDTVLS